MADYDVGFTGGKSDVTFDTANFDVWIKKADGSTQTESFLNKYWHFQIKEHPTNADRKILTLTEKTVAQLPAKHTEFSVQQKGGSVFNLHIKRLVESGGSKYVWYMGIGTEDTRILKQSTVVGTANFNMQVGSGANVYLHGRVISNVPQLVVFYAV